MAESKFPVVFDGHNDTVLSLEGTGRSFLDRSDEGHVDLPRAKDGGLGGGFFAVFIRNQESMFQVKDMDSGAREAMKRYENAETFPESMELTYAQSVALSLLGRLLRAARESNGEVQIVTTAAQLQHCLDNGIFAMELHFEGAEPLDLDGYALEVFYAAGLRSIGLTWSRRNEYATGVPFKFPSSPDIGPGLTDAGKELVRRCNQMGIMLDLSHITEKGFWDVANISNQPLVATHSNAHALTQTPRNLTDKQLDAVKASNGVVGLNYAVGFLRPDGANDADTPISLMADHVAYIADRIGVDHVALGSDYDGATIPAEINDAAGLPKLMQALQERGFDGDDLVKIAHGNWVRVLKDTWGA